MKVLELLDKESKWTRGWEARDVSGKEVFAGDADAVKWCLIGALIKCYGPEFLTQEYNEAYKKLRDAVEKKTGMAAGVVNFNDRSTTTFPDIRAVLVEANV